MQLRMQNVETLSMGQIQEFLQGSETIEFQGQNRAELYGWVQRVLVAQEYATEGRKQRGTVRAYIVRRFGRSHHKCTDEGKEGWCRRNGGPVGVSGLRLWPREMGSDRNDIRLFSDPGHDVCSSAHSFDAV